MKKPPEKNLCKIAIFCKIGKFRKIRFFWNFFCTFFHFLKIESFRCVSQKFEKKRVKFCTFFCVKKCTFLRARENPEIPRNFRAFFVIFGHFFARKIIFKFRPISLSLKNLNCEVFFFQMLRDFHVFPRAISSFATLDV